MIDLRPSNLRYLQRHYLVARNGSKAAVRIDRAVTPKSAKALAWLLRHHDEEDIEDEETWKRDEVDNLLEYYSLLEVASLLQVIPNPLPADVRKAAARHLNHPAIQRYLRHYPLLLPQLCLLRTANLFTKTVTHKKAPALFWQFLELEARLDNEYCETFLWFIDGGCRGDDDDCYDIDDTVALLKSPRPYFRALAVPPDQMSDLHKSLHGMRIFFQFCIDLDQFLAEPSLPPLVRFEAWNFFAYWFRNLALYVAHNELETALDHLKSWADPGGQAMKRSDLRAIGQMREAFDRLMSGEYGRLPPIARTGSHLRSRRSPAPPRVSRSINPIPIAAELEEVSAADQEERILPSVDR